MRLRSRFILAVAAILIASSLYAQDTPFSISPSSGPAEGGTTVTIEGNFGTWPYEVLFGEIPARTTTRIDEHTLVAVTPAHLPGASTVRVFEYDVFLETGLTFTFTGKIPESAFERLLLPILMPPVHGAFGSEFHTGLRLVSTGPRSVQVFGLEEPCLLSPCPPTPDPWDFPIEVTTNEATVHPNGAPGRFVYVSPEDVKILAAHLRVWDSSREDLNFGTEIPIVREDDFEDQRIVLVGVPTDPRFRNTLRIYGDHVDEVYVTVEGRDPVLMTLTPGQDLFTPTYGVFTDFPIGTGPVKVTIDSPPPPTSPPTFFRIWAFVSVTNNDTQLISTITPQP